LLAHSLDDPPYARHLAGGVVSVSEKRLAFSDALRRACRELWDYEAFCVSGDEAEMVQAPRILIERLTDTLCYVACLGKGESRVWKASFSNLRSVLISRRKCPPKQMIRK